MKQRSFVSRLIAITVAALPMIVLAPAVADTPPVAAEQKPTGPVTPPRGKIKVNRTVPSVKRPPLIPEFSAVPTDQEIFRARVFEEPLVPMGSTSAVENRALADAVVGYLSGGRSENLGPIEGFLQRFPNSAWRVALLTDLGIVYRRTGYFTKALAAWQAAWELGKDQTEPNPRAITDRAVGEFLELNARLGRYDVLEALLPEVEKRGVRGSVTEKITGAREGLWLMKNRPEKAFRCGPMALDRILASKRPGYQTDSKLFDSRSTAKGTSLLEMRDLAASVGLPMQMARRTQGAKAVTPAMVHWKAGHFAALVKQEAGRYLMEDPTFGNDLWVSQAALDEEGTGYALIPAGQLPEGWQSISETEGATVWGKGAAYNSSPNPTSPGSNTSGGNSGGNCPMATYAFHTLVVSLTIRDTPVSYSPSRGPGVHFKVFYNQRDAFQPQIFTYSNLGPKWTFDWLSYIEDSGSGNPDAAVNLYVRGAGREEYKGYDSGTLSYIMNPFSKAVLKRNSPTEYERRFPDGSIELFERPDGGSPRKVFLTKIIDPQGNTLTFTYDGSLRLVAAQDALGQVTTISYEHPTDPLKITKVTDPFGRFATFEYDTSSGMLTRITDTIGIQSSFTYASAGDFVTSLTTPYGTTSFSMGLNSPHPRFLEAVDPLGGRERLEWPEIGPFATDPVSTYPTGFCCYNVGQAFSIYWDKRAMALYPGDRTKAVITHWLYSTNFNEANEPKKAEKRPLENRVWYAYPGEAQGNVGTIAQPSKVARVLDDLTQQVFQYEYNAKGMKTREIDPMGRETVYVYGTNNVPDPVPATGTGLDLLQVKVKNNASPGGWDVTASYTYNTQHQQLTATDAAGQVTTYTYDTQGRVETVTTPPRAGITEERTTTYTYDPVTGNVASITAPGSVDTNYTYDDYGRLQTTTDNDGYALTYGYDSLDRQTKVTYPDGTYEETIYSALDLIRRRDRLGRSSHTFYDALRRVSSTRDPEGRTVTQEWCSCGSLDKLIDAKGNATTWERDAQNRITREVRANGSAKEFTYETTTSRLKQVKDAKLQEIHYTYALDDKLLSTTYVNAEHPTPNVIFNYTDPATSAPDAHGRLRQMVDGTGTTTYAYQAITGSPSVGAGQLASVDGPLTNDTISHLYDELGRVVNRTLNGVTSTWSYDQEGRLTTLGDPIGNFTYAYVGNSGRVQSLTYPNNQTTSYAYYPVVQDLRLQEIHHKKPDVTTLNKFNYTYDAVGNILTWTQQTDLNPAKAYDFGYDRADQLTLANFRTTDPTPAILKRYRYAYDAAGNRTAEQIDNVVTGASYDNMNRLVNQQAGGGLLFGGTVNESATVTVGGQPATVTAQNAFSGSAAVPSGTSQVVVQASDPSGNVRTNTYEVNQAGTSTSFTYDPNGNTTSDGVKTFEWDAENRLITVKQGGNTLASFTYDGNARRATKAAAGVTTTFVYAGDQLLEERPNPGTTRRYVNGPRIDHALAQFGGGSTTYNVADHLGSVVGTADSLGNPTLTREYDAWGSPLQGSTTSGYAFTGREWDQETSLYYYRARYYDANTGRFLGPDPRTDNSGLSAYIYVANRPVLFTDPSGMVKWEGTAWVATVTGPIGAGYAVFDLTSECACGRRVSVSVHGVGPGIGVGMKITASMSSIVFFDRDACPHAEGFNGRFSMASAGFTLGGMPIRQAASVGFGNPGLGLGVAQCRAGDKDSQPFSIGPQLGRDLSVTGIVGSSTLTRVRSCACQ